MDSFKSPKEVEDVIMQKILEMPEMAKELGTKYKLD